jgi:hypothetical protein
LRCSSRSDSLRVSDLPTELSSPDQQAAGLYRCEIAGGTATRVPLLGSFQGVPLVGSLMVVVGHGDDDRVHEIVEAHPIPDRDRTVPVITLCGGSAPMYNGLCAEGTGTCGPGNGSCICRCR